MKRMAVLILALVTVLSLVAAGPSARSQMMAAGELHWTQFSVCEHPQTYQFLTYYLIDEEGGELFLYGGEFGKELVGRMIWVEGSLVSTPTCRIVDVNSFEIIKMNRER